MKPIIKVDKVECPVNSKDKKKKFYKIYSYGKLSYWIKNENDEGAQVDKKAFDEELYATIDKYFQREF